MCPFGGPAFQTDERRHSLLLPGAQHQLRPSLSLRRPATAPAAGQAGARQRPYGRYTPGPSLRRQGGSSLSRGSPPLGPGHLIGSSRRPTAHGEPSCLLAFAADGLIPSPPLRRRHVAPLLRAASSLPSPIHPRACHLLLSTSTSTTLPAPFSLEDYLVAACGLAPTQAREVSKKAFRQLSVAYRNRKEEVSSLRLSSASNPDAILALLSSAGLSRADIAAVVSAEPLLLRASANNLAPRLLALRDRVGLSTSQITRFLLVASRALRGGDVAPRLEFFISFYGSFDRVLVLAKGNRSLFTVSLEKIIKPNIALFRQWGVQDIAQLCSTNPWVLTFNSERVKEFLLRAEELGVPPTSRMFRHAVAVITSHSKEKVAAKLEFLKRTLGCSESEVSIAVSKMPQILGLSDATLLRKIEFLITEAAMEPQYIVQRPILLAFSLEKRLVPRHHVMKVLQEKGLLNSDMNLFQLVHYTEEAFKSKFIDCHKDSVPGLADAYAAASASIVPSRV